ncbi:MAG: SRPBCC domain-containing protein [Candidatus Pseudobacter hemicellulosilyticus]|uniref:SRPBCC domain-containing protein n=1 Tax=Candidatus Pseudobacter hemicellulosilyticus TaxID=3121375 RepID=A0AAJ6BIK8_9BACT|nr:MAG: SRPBCC domain-containing protein [Pseudobacter sp.]
MDIKPIVKSIDIQASPEKVWNVLINDQLIREWYAFFSPGSHAITDWQTGSPVQFLDDTQCGMIGKVAASKPNELLDVELTGFIMHGKEDYESEGAKAIKGHRETYRLSKNNDSTTLNINTGMGEDYFETMNTAWDNALQKIKELAEA